tara:strand:+ start:697 stop:3657 length:2961 start_codon:yes stop_codon:yes gene_type:complete
MSEVSPKPILLLVDGHSLAFRSFYAFSKGGEGGLSTKEGIPTSVTYGFLKSLLDNCLNLSPSGVSIAFDTAEPTFRHKTDSNYKANRDVAPEIFFQDLEQLEEILETNLNLSIYKSPGYEADDVLGTLALKASKEGWRVIILSGDRDLFQLVDDKKDIAVMYMGGGPYARNKGPLLIDEKGVEKKLGVLPEKVVDLKSLTGDSSDNIPGVRGVGPKTAINLLKENNNLDGIYLTLDELDKNGEKSSTAVIKGALKEKLRLNKEQAYLSRYLAEILIDVPIERKLEFEFKGIDIQSLSKRLEELELTSLLNKVNVFSQVFSPGGLSINKEKSIEIKKNLENSKEKNDEINSNYNTKIPHQNKDEPELEPNIIQSMNELDILIEKIQIKDHSSPVALDTETTDLNPFKAELVGIGFCWGEGINDLAYIPIGHKSENKGFKQLPLNEVLMKISDWLQSDIYPKVLQNAKYDRLIFLRHGIDLKGVIFDTLLADYLVDSNSKHSLDSIAKREFGFIPKAYNDIVGKNQNFSDVEIHTASIYCCMDVYLTRKLTYLLKSKLNGLGDDIYKVFKNIELPLEKVLAEMEATGIRIDLSYLNLISKEISDTLISLEANIYELSELKFNLSSPKQLGELLFEKLRLDIKKSRRTKTGWSTDATVLERLEDDHPVIPMIIEYRVLSKLLSTYVDSLPQLIEKETGRVHTDFNQAVTATGRLSSSNPNLQNIPIRTEFSRRIRKAFLPRKGWKLLSADYSQIELRILAHLSGEEVLCEAYIKEEDVHSLTAKILLDKDSINSDERRLGKIINFGVIYGMGVQRFARSTGVSQSDAKEFLLKYKKRYSKVFSYLDLQQRLALSKGYVKTILGRRRNFAFSPKGLGRLLGKDPYEINLDLARRAGMEAQQLRAAANAPIQGSSADIIKLAMVRIHEIINKERLPAKMLLQVHDELVLEVEPSAVDYVKKIVINTMENAVKLEVPLLVETGLGENWMEAK